MCYFPVFSKTKGGFHEESKSPYITPPPQSAYFNIVAWGVVSFFSILFSCASVNADSITLVNTQTSNTQTWDTVKDWSNGLAPSSDKDYLVNSGFTLRSPSSASTFTGNSLTLGDANTTGTLEWTSNSTVNNLILVNGTIQGYDGVSGNITLNGAGTLKSTNNGTLRINAPITGTGDLVFDAGVRVELIGNNTYVGNTTIKVTEVRLSSNNSFGTGTVTLSGGTLKNNNNSPTVTNNIIIDENGGTVTAGWNATIHLKGTISGSGNLVLSPEVGATIQLYGDNKDYTGNITIKTGTARLSSSTPFGSGTVTLSGATLKNNNNSPVITNNIILDKNGGYVISGWGSTTRTR